MSNFYQKFPNPQSAQRANYNECNFSQNNPSYKGEETTTSYNTQSSTQYNSQKTYNSQNKNVNNAYQNIYRNNQQSSQAEQKNQNQQNNYYNYFARQKTPKRCYTQQSASMNEKTNQYSSQAKQTNENQQNNYSAREKTPKRCNTYQNASMNEKTQKFQPKYQKNINGFNINQQKQNQQQFTYLSIQYQPQTKVKDWLNLDISNDLNAYQQNYNHIGLTLKENIQYDYAKGCQFCQLKDKGNEIFKQIISQCEKEKVPINQIKVQLQQAMTYYEAAEGLSQLNQEKASIFKNIATINFKLLLYHCQPFNQVDFFKKGISSMKQAFEFAQRDKKKNNDWYAQLLFLKNQTLKEILNTILNQQSNIKIEQSKIISDLKTFAKEISLEIDQDSHLITQKQIFSIQEEFIQDCKQSEDFIQAQNLQENLNLDLKRLYEASQKSSNEKIKFYFNQRYLKLDESLLEYQAFKYLQLGNQIYKNEQDKKIIQVSYKLIDSESIWDAVDAYKAAIKLFEGKFLHIEAESYFMLGQIYQEMFGNDNQKVHEYIRNSISLDFNSTKINRKQWYSSAIHIMKILQDKSVEKDSQMFEIWKSKNKNIIDQIDLNQSKGIVEFTKWITKMYMPSFCQNFQLENFENNKKLLHKVMLLYHGDKITGESQHFKFIAKQIMIHLTTFYEQVKG
ncbi:hypothetical protein TTHERM_00655990 (macronuclear) [Tetrahymena thermophila SB210]|uniref:Uncharacterized protein n=1 Tax=Tetrahymena thermophila (strain SB210) TaxID=312017 RepID=Q22GV7_TETTS|nr:hypothetical protein TTHERM_00655990 [Tetrahymena thermophila SB210]EAR84567.1 hypothetical protein TTHERM_00655990 [Tetrahymena thermophila SB210]|eukprot:XP_001032230.1 hypothetical protein TTHERM_00655990 [Tetrahymena thermophila SB210]